MKIFTRKTKATYDKPVLRIFSTVVPQAFEDKFKDWDKRLASKNIQTIKT